MGKPTLVEGKPAYLWRKLRASVAKRGLAGTIRVACEYALEPFARFRPRRLRKRWSDWIYDLRHGVDTSATVDLERLRIDAPTLHSAKRYQASSAGLFHQAITCIRARLEDFVFIDFGAGKGKCLLMASDYPFRKIVGVEFSTELAEVARRNLRTYRSPRQRCRQWEVVACDATRFELPAEPAICYFYNPFEADVMCVVRDNIRRSLEACPRPAYVLYYNPLHREVFDQASWLELVNESADCCVYANRIRDEQVSHRS